MQPYSEFSEVKADQIKIRGAGFDPVIGNKLVTSAVFEG